MNPFPFRSPFVPLLLGLGLIHCSSPATSSDAGTSSDVSALPDVSLGDCASETTYAAQVACSTNAFLATLSTTERATAALAFTDSVGRTRWSNLPGPARSGIRFGDMSTTSQTAAIAVARAALTDQGFEDFTGVRAADDYLNANGGGSGYGSGNYYVAVFGDASATGTWMLQLGGHHMAYNLTFQNGVLAPTPNHLGAEPKASFSVNGSTYAPTTDEGDAFFGVFTALDTTQLAAAYLSGQSFDDVVLGPDEYGTGSLSSVVFPTGSARTGVLVSSLTAAQQALVTTAIERWVRDYPAEVADPLMADYTSATALADTYIAWGGTQSSGPDPDVSGTYLRIDGPRVWIELAAQSGVVIHGLTHFHTIYRDKTQQYGGTL